MPGDWIPVEHATPGKPEVKQLAEQLGVSENEVLGGLIRFWIWCDSQLRDGDAESVTKKAVDRITNVTNLYDALKKVGWLVENESGIHVPNYEYHLSQSAKTRALTRKRTAKYRARLRDGDAESVTDGDAERVTMAKNQDTPSKCDAPSVTKASQQEKEREREKERKYQREKERKREKEKPPVLQTKKQLVLPVIDKKQLVTLPVDKRREEKKPPKPPMVPLSFPEELDDPECRKAIDRFLAYRKEIKRPYKSAQSVNVLLRRWAEHGRAAFLDAIERTVANGWQGLVEPDKEYRDAKPARAGKPAGKNRPGRF